MKKSIQAIVSSSFALLCILVPQLGRCEIKGISEGLPIIHRSTIPVHLKESCEQLYQDCIDELEDAATTPAGNEDGDQSPGMIQCLEILDSCSKLAPVDNIKV